MNMQSNCLILVVLTSYGTSFLFHLLIKKYVFTIYKGLNDSTADPSSFDHLLIEKKSFWGFKRILNVPLSDLVNGESIFNTWKSIKTGEGFLIQFVPPEVIAVANTSAVNLGNVTSYQGKPVDIETMSKIYNEISNRRQ